MTEPSEPMTVVYEIVKKLESIEFHWKDIHGWGPPGAAEILERARLDRLTSLARCLAIWFQPAPAGEQDGRLILGWGNLGSLVEGTMTFFLSVYHSDYLAGGNTIPPDDLWLAWMKKFFVKSVWTAAQITRWEPYVDDIHALRNSIHPFKDRPIKTFPEFEVAVRDFEDFLKDAVGNLPDPPPVQDYAE